MSKTIAVSFPAGTEVVIMLNNNPVTSKIRAVQYSESVTGEQVEQVKSSLVYSTFAAPNKSLSEKDIALTKEELAQKKFSN